MGGAAHTGKEGGGPNINDWAEVIRPYDEELAKRIGISRLEGLQAAEALGLPMHKKLVIALKDFLSSPETYTNELDSDKYIVGLVPKNDSLPRVTRGEVALSEVLALIQEKIPHELQGEYQVVILPYYDVQYGGNIVVNPNNTIVIEFRHGHPGPVAYGKETPPFSAYRDEFLGSFKYNFEDEKIRSQMAEVVGHIPHSKEGRDAEYHPGYYEFVVVEKDEDKPPETLFLDYRDDPSYFTDSAPKGV